jgi:hypothetical protein
MIVLQSGKCEDLADYSRSTDLLKFEKKSVDAPYQGSGLGSIIDIGLSVYLRLVPQIDISVDLGVFV